MSSILKGLQLNELSTNKLAQYKTAAAADAKKADSESDYKRGDKRFSGIVKATKKQFANDEKKEVAEGYGRNSYAYRQDGGANDERHDLDPSDWYFVKDGKMFAISVYPRQEQEAIERGYSRTRAEAKAKSGQQGMTDDLDENLHKWFKEKWVRFGPDGKIRGDCARGDDSEGKPKCLPQSKAHSLGKKGRASAASRKRREDPNPERSGKAINVNTKKKTNETELDEACWKGYHKEGNKKMFGKTYPNCVKNTNEEQELEEYGDTPKGQKMLDKVHHRAADRVTSKKADTDPQYARKAQQTQDRAHDRLKDVAEGEIEQQHGDIKPWAYWGYPERVAKKLYQIHRGEPIDKSAIVQLWKVDGPDRMTKFMLKPDVSAILSAYEQMSNEGPLFKEGVVDTVKKKAKEFGKYMTEPQSPHNNFVRDRAKNIEKIRKQKEKDQGVTEAHHSESCPHCGGEMVSEELMNEKKDACYYKVKSRYKVWPSAYASGALVKCRKKGASNWGNGGKSNESVAEDDAGDVEQRMLVKIEKEKQRLAKLKQTDPEAYKREMEKRKTSSRVPPVSTFEDQGVAEGPGFDKWADDRAASQLHKLKPGMVQDRKTGKWYDPNKEFDKKMNSPEVMAQMKRMAQKEGIKEDQLDEKWTKKYKDSINCSNPKGFSQKAHCAGKQKNESAIMSGLNQLDEGWKEKLGAAALAGSMALGAGAAHSRVTPDGQGGFTGGLKPSATVTAPSDNKPAAEAPKGFSKEYLQKAADPNRTGKYMISVERAQELLKSMP